MASNIERRLQDAFLILAVRQSERTTAQEVQLTQLELEQQLGGLFSLLTVEFLVPYLNRKLNVAQKTGEIPRLPKGGIVKPTIVAGINALGRGQDRESLGQFLTVIAQTMGPEAIQQFINPEEVVKRLAAASGIDVLNLVKSMQEIQQEQQQAIAQQQQMMAQQQEPQMAAVDQKREQAEAQMMMQQQQQPPMQ
jgi:stage V sporulation protein SpoVS